ncbi:hypothetical protein DY000_02022724 [Brassica cretica]|uniref:Uncharacterized protein n=1 Tax=Brassica cretica TaxID=69181 RepID=A0ABQ7EGJ1_BRACR|nr:hypothetical protein DY000_02022724 [Brassica cretica]
MEFTSVQSSKAGVFARVQLPADNLTQLPLQSAPRERDSHINLEIGMGDGKEIAASLASLTMQDTVAVMLLMSRGRHITGRTSIKKMDDYAVAVASKTENVSHNSGKRLTSTIVTPLRSALPNDANVTVRSHGAARTITFSPMEKTKKQFPKGDDLIIDALQDMDIAGSVIGGPD